MMLDIQNVQLGTLIPHPKNVRQGDIGAIAESLRIHGQYRPIVVQKSTNYILAGNHTWKAARSLGWNNIAVTFIDVDDEQAARILLVDNRANDLATYDDESLAKLLKELAHTEASLEGTGFDGDDLDDLLFRLEGSSGTLNAGVSATERLEAFEARGIRSVVLPFPEEQYGEMIELLQKLRNVTGVDNNSDAVFGFLQENL